MADDAQGLKELRESFDSLQKAVGEKDKLIGQLQSENRSMKAETLFSAAGFAPSQAKLYPADRDLTPEAVKAFAEEFNLTGPAPASGGTQGSPQSSATPTAQSVGSPDLSLIGQAGSRAGTGGQPPAGSEKISTAKLSELMRTNRPAAEKAIADGRVEFEANNFYVQQGLVRQ